MVIIANVVRILLTHFQAIKKGAEAPSFLLLIISD